jgi:branched-chain amino acid transport system substrate-binding protein
MLTPPTVAKIGFQLPAPDVHTVTGYLAAEMAVEECNGAKRLPFEVELVPVIDHRNRDRARDAAHAFVEDPAAVAMLGPINSDMAIATQDIYGEAGMAQVSSEASSPLLTSGGQTHFFRLVANDEVQGRALAQAATSYLGAKRIAVLSDNSGWGRPIAQIFAEEVRRLGAEVVLERYFGAAEDALDFDGLVDATVGASPDLVYFAVYWNKAHILAHRLRDRGLAARFLGSDALKPYAFLEVPTLDPESPHHSLAGIDMRLKPSARPFFEAFALRHPMLLVAPQYAAEAYDAAGLLLEALARAGRPDRAAVLAEMQARHPYSGALGPIAFDERGDLVDAEIGLYTCRDGIRHYIGPIKELVG